MGPSCPQLSTNAHTLRQDALGEVYPHPAASVGLAADPLDLRKSFEVAVSGEDSRTQSSANARMMASAKLGCPSFFRWE